MRLRIVHKLFVTLLVATSASLLVLAALTHWSLGRGFLHYVNQVEKQTVADIAATLAGEYRTLDGWASLRGDRRAVSRIIRRSLWQDGGARSGHEPGMADREPRHPAGWRRPGPPRHWRGPGQRLSERLTLYDAAREPVVGAAATTAPSSMLPIEVEGEIVGWLGYEPLRRLAAAPDLRFLRQQYRALLFSVLGLAVLAALLAVLLARQLSRPIEAITQGIEQLAAGRFGTRLTPLGDDELGDLTADVNRLATTLEENEGVRRRWIADISHELRTPLTILRGEVDAVQDDIRPCDMNFAHSVDTEVARLSKLVDDLYQLSVADLGALDYRFEPCAMATVIRDSVAAFETRLTDAGLTVELALTEETVLSADPARLAQLFGNLLENSCRYTRAPGRLRIGLSAETDTVTVVFADSAPGVTAAQATQLFEPLYRVDASRNRAHGGAGLGLSICRKIVAAHRGTLTAGASALGGLEIRMTLPRGAAT